MSIHLNEFRGIHLDPARDECARLQAEIDSAEAEYAGLIATREYDDAAAASVQLRLEALERDLRRWQRRVNFLTSCENAQSGGKVPVDEATNTFPGRV